MKTQTKKTTKAKTSRSVFKPGQHENRTYERLHELKDLSFGIRRGDTRHGDYSAVVVADRRGDVSFEMTLAEARSFKAFLERELEVRAR